MSAKHLSNNVLGLSFHIIVQQNMQMAYKGLSHDKVLLHFN